MQKLGWKEENEPIDIEFTEQKADPENTIDFRWSGTRRKRRRYCFGYSGAQKKWHRVQKKWALCKNNDTVCKKNDPCAKKNDTVCKKKDPLCKKNEPR